MADRNIDIRLVIDGKEAIATLSLTDQKVKEITKSLAVVKPIPNPISAGAVQNVSAMNNTMSQFGWILGDANMFMVNFRMGMMSIGNNIPMVVLGFQRAQQEAKALGISLKQSLMTSLMGPGGVMLGINALMFALQVIPALFENSSKKVDEQAEKVKNLAGEYKNLAVVQLEEEKSKLYKTKELLEKEIKSLEKKAYVGGYNVSAEYGVVSRDQAKTDRKIKELDELNEKINAIEKAWAKANNELTNIKIGHIDIRAIANIDKAIATLKLEYENVKTDTERKELATRMNALKLEKEALTGKQKIIDANAEKNLFTTEAQLQKEMAILQARLKQIDNLRDQLIIKQKIKDIEKEINAPFSFDASEIGVKGLDKNGTFRTNGVPNQLESNWNTNRLASENPTLKYLEQEIDMTQTLGAVWQRTGSVMATSLSRALGLFKQTNNVIQEILKSIAEMAIQMASIGLIKGIIGLATGGGFMSGFLDIFGGGKSVQAGGQSNMATPFMPVSSVRQFGSSQNININVSGSLIGKGTSLVSTFNKSQKIINKVY